MGALNCLNLGNNEPGQIQIKKSKASNRKTTPDTQLNQNRKSGQEKNSNSSDLKNDKQTVAETNKADEISDHECDLFGVCPADIERGESFMENYNRLLNGNIEYTKEKIKEDPMYFLSRAKDQKPKYLLIGCADSRVPPNEITKTNPGDIFIHRNIANQVIHSDLNCMSVIQYAVEFLGVEHVIVMGHTKCGGVHASKSKAFKGLLESWIQNIRDVALSNKAELEKCSSDKEYFEKLTIFNIRQQVWNVCKTSFVQKAWANGKKLHIHGWITDIETGLIHDLKMDNQGWDALKGYYDFTFK